MNVKHTVINSPSAAAAAAGAVGAAACADSAGCMAHEIP
jgi:hypothetical protein